MNRFFSLPIRVHMIVLVILSILPAFLVILHLAVEQRLLLKTQVRAENVRLLDLMVDRHRDSVDNTQQFLTLLSNVPAVKNRDYAASNKLFYELRQLKPEYLVLFVVDLKGDLVVYGFAHNQPTKKINVTDRGYFKTVIETGDFAIGKAAVSRTTGEAVFHYAYPIFDANGKLQSVLGASVDIDLFARIFMTSELPSGSDITVMDRDGVVVFSSSDASKVGKINNTDLAACKAGLESRKFVGGKDANGDGRVYMCRAVQQDADKDPYLYIRVSFLEEEIYGPGSKRIVIHTAILVLVAILAMIIAWGWGSYTITNPVNSLLKTVRKLEQGDLSAKTGLDGVGREINELGKAFDNMSESLALRELQKGKAIQEAKEREEQLRTLVNSVPDIVCFKDGQGRWIETNDYTLKLFHLQGVAYDGKTVEELAEHGGFYRDFLLKISQLDEEVWELGKSIRQDEVVPMEDGSFLIFDLIKVPTFYPDGSRKAILVIGRDITERRRVEDELESFNHTLEQRVKERTLQLEASNKELEAFSYSVSHDLKAPLRALNGFSQIFVEGYADQLNDDGKECLEHIIAVGDRMGGLIDSLLKLSRITQKQMQCVKIDFTNLVNDIVEELRQEYPERQVDFATATDLWGHGDLSLMRIALVNLLGNAWKFTANKPDATVEFGAFMQDNKKIYYVRDNGAGFDMEYKNKLFQAFQRLHLRDEFEGTGVGLAIVKRIIMKHGGEIWAQAEVNKGATFYFTLQEGCLCDKV